MKRTINFVAAAVLVFGATAAFGAGTASSSNSNNVSATVAAVCTVDVFNLAFGAYDPLGTTPVDANATISVACTKGMSPTLSLSAGRTMTNGTDNLTYTLWSNSGYTTAWTDGVSVGTSANPATAMTVPVYGRLATGQNVSAGSYAGTLNATVNW